MNKKICEYCEKEHLKENTGCKNSGDRNSGYFNSGWFNTSEPKMRFFNKDSDIIYSEFKEKTWVVPDLRICAWYKLSTYRYCKYQPLGL